MKNFKKKYLFLGDVDSINVEIIAKSLNNLKNEVHYLIICNKFDLKKTITKINKEIKINEIFDPFKFEGLDKQKLNFFNIENISKHKADNLINQLRFSNQISTKTNIDLVTMPIQKSLIKKKINFNGVTEFLGKINKTKTFMLMHGRNFSVIPLTTHINPKNISKTISRDFIWNNLYLLTKILKKNKNNYEFSEIKFLCYNPHCGEEGTLGNEDKNILKIIKSFPEIKEMVSADSAFLKFKKKTLFISTYHDQCLIPFKIFNKNGINITLGLNYRRISPSHGTAKNIKFFNLAKNDSYLECMKF